VFVVEREGVAVFDADTAELATRYPCHTDGFLNDLAIAPEGTLYVSDSLKNRLYRIEDGTCQEWMSGWPLVAPNGVLVDGDTLLVGNMQAGNLLFVDRKTRDIRSVIELEPGGVDGLAHDGHGGYLVSHYQGRILQVQTSGQVEVLVDSRPAGRFCADFEYVVEKGLFVVPDLRGNGLYAYQRHP
jgi:sugar lactone lactonase YvrE